VQRRPGAPAAARRASAHAAPGFLEEAIITIIEEAIGPQRQPPFADPWEVLEAGERFKAAMAEGFPPATPGQLETRGFAR